MKYLELSAIAQHLQQFSTITQIYRTENNTILIEFNKQKTFFFDMTKSNSTIYMQDNHQRGHYYQAPFDITLHKKVMRSQIKTIQVLKKDKVLQIDLIGKSSYKKEQTRLQFEFTGKHTNIIILDKNNIILEALRHISSIQSSRIVTVNSFLEDIPSHNFEPKEFTCNNIESYLYSIYTKRSNSLLESLKKQKIDFINKKIKQHQKILAQFQSQEYWEEESQKNYNFANIILANLYQIKPYKKSLDLKDFNSNDIKIELPKVFSNVSQISEYFFKLAKKSKQKAKYIYIEKNNLDEKIEYLSFLKHNVETAENIQAISFLFPKQKQEKKTKRKKSYQIFWIDGYKVLLGKNTNANIELLKDAKASNIWFHLQGIPSAHVIVVTDKKQLPQNVLKRSAQLCLDFSTTQIGDFLVDYTQRREVKIQESANVLYNKYQTIRISKE
jgi:predicted ribosome quality control (RQC) complex YloA/Tae2 family protein